MKFANNNPIRVRSKTTILFYESLSSINIELLIDHLKIIYRINSSKEWKYLLKSETSVEGKHIVQILIDCKNITDVYSYKFVFKTENSQEITPAIWAYKDLTPFLFLMLKDYENLNINKELITNMSNQELDNYRTLIKFTNITQTTSSLTFFQKEIIQNTSSYKSELTQKQLNKIIQHQKLFEALIEKPTDNSSLPSVVSTLNKYLTNVRNYRYKYTLPDNIISWITTNQRRFTNFKHEKGFK